MRVTHEASRQAPLELLVEELCADGRTRFHVVTDLTREGATLLSSEGLAGRRYLWLRLELPGQEGFLPVLAELRYERRLGQMFHRGVSFKHIFAQHQAAFFSYVDACASARAEVVEVRHA